MAFAQTQNESSLDSIDANSLLFDLNELLKRGKNLVTKWSHLVKIWSQFFLIWSRYCHSSRSHSVHPHRNQAGAAGVCCGHIKFRTRNADSPEEESDLDHRFRSGMKWSLKVHCNSTEVPDKNWP